MSGQNVIPLDPSRRAPRKSFLENGTISMLIFLIFDAMILAGMVGAFVLTRAAADSAWPPTGQPWFPLGETAINSAALLVSGVLILRAAHLWKKRETRVAPLLFAAIVLGVSFLFFQSVIWISLMRQGFTLASIPHGPLFYLIVATHGVHVLGAVIFMGIAWLRLKPLRDNGDLRGTLSNDTFSAARFLWYFSAFTWPILYLCLYL